MSTAVPEDYEGLLKSVLFENVKLLESFILFLVMDTHFETHNAITG